MTDATPRVEPADHTGSTDPAASTDHDAQHDQETDGPKVRQSMTLGARMLALPIIAYRRYVSPALPARCRFYPSCSAYALEAISTHGALRGVRLAVWRLLRCQPFNAGGYDPVPPPREHRPSGA